MNLKIHGTPPVPAKPEVSGVAPAGVVRRQAVEAVQGSEGLRLTDETTELRVALGRQAATGGEVFDRDRVDALRAAIAGGTYTVDADAIATRMLAVDEEIGR